MGNGNDVGSGGYMMRVSVAELRRKYDAGQRVSGVDLDDIYGQLGALAKRYMWARTGIPRDLMSVEREDRSLFVRVDCGLFREIEMSCPCCKALVKGGTMRLGGGVGESWSDPVMACECGWRMGVRVVRVAVPVKEGMQAWEVRFEKASCAYGMLLRAVRRMM